VAADWLPTVAPDPLDGARWHGHTLFQVWIRRTANSDREVHMNTAAITAAQDTVIDIPLPTDSWHGLVDESVEFEVQTVSLDRGHFGTTFRRC
jgi:hypothetical protein